MCIGDSITEGGGSSNMKTKSYPTLLQKKLGEKFAVINEGMGGRTAIENTNEQYQHEPEYEFVLNFKKPDVAILMLGTNDSKEKYWDMHLYFKDFKDFASRLAKHYDQLFIGIPPPVYFENFGIQ